MTPSDQGKPATSTKERDSFNEMIADCYAGKIDMILTKSISRFARNTVDFLRIIRELKERQIRIIFEKENIDTMDSTGELLITILSSQVQEELKMRKNKADHGLKYSSKYPLSGLITCGDCTSGYIRCIWQNKKGEKTAVWRCKDGIKTGASNCSTVCNLKEGLVYDVLVDSLSSLLTADKSTLSSMELQDIARIKKTFGEKKITPKSIEHIRLSNIVASITALNTKQIEIKFYSGMTLVKDLG